MSYSLLVDSVLVCLADHPHDSTCASIANRLGDIGDEEAVEAALEILRQDNLVIEAGGRFGLSAPGWRRRREHC